MAYEIRTTAGQIFTVVEDGTIKDNVASISFFGKRYVDYGLVFNNNMLSLLENFSNTTPPLNPVIGQMWFDASPGVEFIKVYVSVTSGWKPLEYTVDLTSAVVNNDLVFTGEATFSNNATFVQDLTANNIFPVEISFSNGTITGSYTTSSDVAHSGFNTFDGATTFNGVTTFSNPMTFDSNVSINTTLNVIGLSTLVSVDIDSGAIDNVVIGAGTANAGSFTTISTTSTSSFGGLIEINNGWEIGAVVISTTGAELNFVDGVTSNIQTQLDGKISGTSPTITGTPTATGATWADLGTVTTVDINGGTIDATPIGATTPSTIAITTADASTSYSIASTKVVGSRVTGWTAASGTSTRSTFDTTTVTTAALAEHVKALLDDLITHGLIGT